MTNINCSAKCSYENNGKCTLNHIGISSNIAGTGGDCAYFQPRQSKSSKDKQY
ncbi:hypothetical protein OXPF_04110 [Oxobacter pfennigii]|uniref:Hydroxymyristoyl-ACP dehydratase n=1 Tax=Oxobacter pfennigii TaxID=36849 RepID=A0A0P8Z1E6_9CLOT|nr:DUF1540 domain-containing protein [Oxobacter pfennigii]KPU45943.1 hypothetical protein OXPF_04110 [Oxobacter pfennigii]